MFALRGFVTFKKHLDNPIMFTKILPDELRSYHHQGQTKTEGLGWGTRSGEGVSW